MQRIAISLSFTSSLLLSCLVAAAQTSDTASVIRQAVESKQWATAKTELEKVRNKPHALFRENDYDYLVARIAEEGGDLNAALKTYQATIANGSALSQYALWHLSRFARS